MEWDKLSESFVTQKHQFSAWIQFQWKQQKLQEKCQNEELNEKVKQQKKTWEQLKKKIFKGLRMRREKDQKTNKQENLAQTEAHTHTSTSISNKSNANMWAL